jgi:hypothetical protein
VHHPHRPGPVDRRELWSAINTAVADVRSDLDRAGVEAPEWGQVAVDVTVGLVTGARAIDHRRPEVVVHVDWATLRGDATAAGIVCELDDGTALAPAAVRRLCCDADLYPAVIGGDGAALDVGRSRRLASCDQRRALSAMYTRCGFPDCHVAVEHCRIHHATDWTRGGRTDPANLIPLCATHHHLVHEGGWTLTLHLDRTITLTQPDHTTHHHSATTGRHPTRAGPAP